MKWYWQAIIIEALIIGLLVYMFVNQKPVTITDPVVVTDTIYETELVYQYYDSSTAVHHMDSTGVYTEITGRVDTFYLTKTDTIKIVQDWETERTYNTNLFNISDFAKCDISMHLEFNRVSNVSYELTRYQPKEKYHLLLGGSLYTNNSYFATAGINYSHFEGLLHLGYNDGFACGTTLMYRF